MKQNENQNSTKLTEIFKKERNKYIKVAVVCTLLFTSTMFSGFFCFANTFKGDKYKQEVLQNHEFEEKNRIYQEEKQEDLDIMYKEGKLSGEEYIMFSDQNYDLDKEQFFKENVTAEELEKYNEIKKVDACYENALYSLAGVSFAGMATVGALAIKEEHSQRKKHKEEWMEK